MPGVGSNEAEEVGSALQKVSQTMSTETSQLVNAIANLELDLEDAKRTNVRLTIQEKLLSAEVDDKAGKISDLCAEREAETQKRELAEYEVKKIMEDLTKLSAEFKTLKKSGSPKESNSMESNASPRDALVKVGQPILSASLDF
jgi:predicted  nucleic acid-binding Zn-ribbon protein